MKCNQPVSIPETDFPLMVQWPLHRHVFAYLKGITVWSDMTFIVLAISLTTVPSSPMSFTVVVPMIMRIVTIFPQFTLGMGGTLYSAVHRNIMSPKYTILSLFEKLIIASVGENTEKLEPYSASGKIKWYTATPENSLAFPQRVQHHMTKQFHS